MPRLAMPHVLEELASALRQEPAGSSPWAVEQRESLTVLEVVVRDLDLLVTFRWKNHPYRLVYALKLDDVMLEGGGLDLEDASADFWASEARDALHWIGKLDPLRSRRRPVGDAVEIAEHELPDDRFFSSRSRFSEVLEDWDLVSHGGTPGEPPPTVAATRDDGSLLAWHLVRMEHRYPLPYLGQVATRWESPTVASIYFLEVAADMPAVLPLVLVSGAMQFAASRGASRVRTDVEVPHLHLLGFCETDGVWESDTRFLEVDNDALDVLAREDWKYPPALRAAIKRASQATYFAK